MRRGIVAIIIFRRGFFTVLVASDLLLGLFFHPLTIMMAGATSGPLTDMTAVVVLTWCHCQPDQRGSSEPLFCMWGMFKGPPHVQTCRFDDVCVERRKIPSPSPESWRFPDTRKSSNCLSAVASGLWTLAKLPVLVNPTCPQGHGLLCSLRLRCGPTTATA